MFLRRIILFDQMKEIRRSGQANKEVAPNFEEFSDLFVVSLEIIKGL